MNLGTDLHVVTRQNDTRVRSRQCQRHYRLTLESLCRFVDKYVREKSIKKKMTTSVNVLFRTPLKGKEGGKVPRVKVDFGKCE